MSTITSSDAMAKFDAVAPIYWAARQRWHDAIAKRREIEDEFLGFVAQEEDDDKAEALRRRAYKALRSSPVGLECEAAQAAYREVGERFEAARRAAFPSMD